MSQIPDVISKPEEIIVEDTEIQEDEGQVLGDFISLETTKNPNFTLDDVQALIDLSLQSFSNPQQITYVESPLTFPQNFVTYNTHDRQVDATYNSFEDGLRSLTTSSVTEGSNLYFTNSRVADYISASSTLSTSAVNYWTKSGTSLTYMDGYVGVGTSTPSDTLSVEGPIYMGRISAPLNSSDRLYNVAGDLYFAGSLIGGATTGNWTTDGTNVWRAGGVTSASAPQPQEKDSRYKVTHRSWAH